MEQFNIEWKDIASVKPYARNAKKHDETQIANVAESIKQFGWQQPIVCDADGVIIIGHCRLLAAKKLGLKKVPVKTVDNLSEEQVKKLRALDNKLNESDWDFDLLAEDIGELDFRASILIGELFLLMITVKVLNCLTATKAKYVK